MREQLGTSKVHNSLIIKIMWFVVLGHTPHCCWLMDIMVNIAGDREKLNKLVQMAWTFTNDRFFHHSSLLVSLELIFFTASFEHISYSGCRLPQPLYHPVPEIQTRSDCSRHVSPGCQVHQLWPADVSCQSRQTLVLILHQACFWFHGDR